MDGHRVDRGKASCERGLTGAEGQRGHAADAQDIHELRSDADLVNGHDDGKRDDGVSRDPTEAPAARHARFKDAAGNIIAIGTMPAA